MKLKRNVQWVIEKITLFIGIVLFSINDFEVNLPTLAVLGVLMAVMTANIYLLYRYGENYDEDPIQE